jgi:predicted membrane protein
MYTLCAAIATALIGAAFVGTGACAAEAAKIESHSIATDGDTSKDLHETWNVASDARIEIGNVRGTVTVTTWDKPVADLSGTLGGDSKLDISGDAGHLTLKVQGIKNGWSGNGPDSDSDLILRVPRTAALDVGVVSADANVNGAAGKTLEVASVSGTVTINSGAPDVDVNSVSGDVMFDAAAKTSMTRAHLQTVSGNINAKGLSGRLKVETVSGDMSVDAGQVQDLEAGTVSGDVNLTFTPAAHANIKLESMSGDLRLHLPSSLSAHIEATTFSGGIDSDFGKVQEKEMGPGSSLDAQAGSGDAKISAQSFSGDIQVRRQ